MVTLAQGGDHAKGYSKRSNGVQHAPNADRAGSYKASIVSIWVTVTFDIIAKTRELADQGEAIAAILPAQCLQTLGRLVDPDALAL